jgi:hypothetical protein
MIFPAILNPFVAGAAPAVMTGLALDCMIEGTSIDTILEELAAEQYTGEFMLGHFVQVMCDVACGFQKFSQSVFLKWDRSRNRQHSRSSGEQR